MNGHIEGILMIVDQLFLYRLVIFALNINVFKKSIPFIVAMITVSCIYTIIGNIAIPGASRMLAGSAIEGTQTYSLIHSMYSEAPIICQAIYLIVNKIDMVPVHICSPCPMPTGPKT